MRSTRKMVILAALAAASIVAAGCSSGGESVTTDLGLVDTIDETNTRIRSVEGATDEAALRSDLAGAGESARSGAGADQPAAGATSADATTGDAVEADGTPTPPTLSPAGAAALDSSTSDAPPAAPASPSTTAATTTTTSADGGTTATTGTGSSTTTTAEGSTTVGTETTAIAAPGGDLDRGEDHSQSLLNQLRSGIELSALNEDADMAAFARDWSRQMASSGDFVHSDGPYGENIAFTSDTGLTPEAAAELFHQLWIDSDGHYRNMTNGSYTRIGVGLFLTERGWYGTHVFAF